MVGAAVVPLNTRELVDGLRRNVDNPWTPPGGGQIAALSHDVIHGLDITEPLGLDGPPPERVALVLQETRARQTRYFGVDVTGRRLVAHDVDIAVGTGPSEIRLGAKDILLVVTGRKSIPTKGSE